MAKKKKIKGYSREFIVIVLVLLAAFGYWIYQGFTIFSKTNSQIVKVETKTETITENTPPEEITPTPYNPYNKTYISKNLGIKFNYSSHNCWPDEKVTIGIIHEVGNTIYYTQRQNNSLSSGHTIQVFSKSAFESLVTAINNNLLKNYNRVDCYAVESTVQPKAPKGWSEAEVVFPDDKNPMDITNLPNCSQDYEKFNRMRSFWMNPEEPTKYIFLDMGNATLGCGGADIDLESITFLK